MAPAGYITACGIVSGLALDSVTHGAAARAGMSRAREHESLRIVSPETGEPVAVVVHEALELTRGFEGPARLVTLMQGALRDLGSQIVAKHLAYPEQVVLAVPHPERLAQGAALVGEPDRDAVQADWKAWLDEFDRDDWEETVREMFASAWRVAGWPRNPSVQLVTAGDHPALATALQAALRDIAGGASPTVLVLCADSLVDLDVVEWLDKTQRLKIPGTPAGLQPGEAAVALLVSGTIEPDATRTAAILAVEMAEDDVSFYDGDAPDGKTLCQLCQTAIGDDEPFSWYLSDQNGEVFRAQEWGNLLVHLKKANKLPEDVVVDYPALAVGDTGIAAGGVAVAYALHRWARACAPENRCAIMLSGADQQRAVVILQAANMDMER